MLSPMLPISSCLLDKLSEAQAAMPLANIDGAAVTNGRPGGLSDFCVLYHFVNNFTYYNYTHLNP